MLRTSKHRFCVVVLTISSAAVAKQPDANCLQHLGGGYGDALCYSALSADFVAQNKQLYYRIRATIPAGNAHAKVLDDYVLEQDRAVKYCELARNAGAGWRLEHDGSMFPALYEQCVYDLRKAENQFLKGILEMAKW